MMVRARAPGLVTSTSNSTDSSLFRAAEITDPDDVNHHLDSQYGNAEELDTKEGEDHSKCSS